MPRRRPEGNRGSVVEGKPLKSDWPADDRLRTLIRLAYLESSPAPPQPSLPDRWLALVVALTLAIIAIGSIAAIATLAALGKGVHTSLWVMGLISLVPLALYASIIGVRSALGAD